ncbi:hypothetical protein HLH36_00485 [Gluconacetobacter aggeris]|uniref:G domain-containing protein n=1 Tax=Gluconacetobacter aggeris TaxID=1286186 RepID=A0A7W4IQC1_9PROT|nr:GTPase [Gluconacetobacter aggeris]MBB2166847.1 hypothetical protein [Gluconacetobacter aggeris]
MEIPDFDNILTTFEKVRPVVKYWLGPEKEEEMAANLTAKSKTDRPRIMVYGVYNAGKSTLLNALMGAEKASMADRPETAEVKGYDWKGYSLLDTPGIDAPIEHEEVTEDSLNQSDVVLFVVAAGGTAAENATWEAMVDIVARNRRVMLVINDKLGLERDSEDFLTVIDGARAHMQMAADKAGVQDILETVPVSVVNARTALKGRLEDKNLLIKRSGLEQLEQKLAAFLDTCDFATVCRSAAKDVQDLIDAAGRSLEEKQGTRESKNVEELDQGVRKGKERIRTRTGTALDTAVVNNKPRVAAYCRSKAEDVGYPPDELNAITEQMEKKVLESLVKEAEEVFRELDQNYQPTEISSIGRVGAGHIHMDIGTDGGRGALAGELTEMTRSLGQHLSGISSQDMAGVAKNVLTYGKELSKKPGHNILKSLFKGVGEKKIGLAAEKIGKAVGPALAIGTALYSVGHAISQDRAERQAKERIMQAIQDAADNYLSTFKDAATQWVNEQIIEIFSGIDASLRESKAEILQENKTLAHDRTILAEGTRKLEKIYT